MVPQHVVVPAAHGARRRCAGSTAPAPVVRADHPELGTWHLHAADDAELLFCDNETNAARLWGAGESPPFPKDGIADHVVHGHADRQPRRRGHQGRRPRPPRRPRRRLGVDVGPPDAGRRRRGADPFADADAVVAARRAEADEFYAAITPDSVVAPTPPR